MKRSEVFCPSSAVQAENDGAGDKKGKGSKQGVSGGRCSGNKGGPVSGQLREKLEKRSRAEGCRLQTAVSPAEPEQKYKEHRKNTPVAEAGQKSKQKNQQDLLRRIRHPVTDTEDAQADQQGEHHIKGKASTHDAERELRKKT